MMTKTSNPIGTMETSPESRATEPLATPKRGSASRRVRALSALSLALLACWSSQALALSLGKVNVVSALGEPLQAEVDLNDVTAPDLETLRISLASPADFRTAGLEYNAVLSATRIEMAKRADGRSYFRLVSDRVVNDPFVDLIVEVSWSAGRIVRDYTLLFDPRNLMTKAPVAPQLAALPAPAVAAPSTSAARAKPEAAPAAAPAPAKTTAKSKPLPKVISSTAESAAVGTVGTVQVKPGDTAGKLAQSQVSDSVSLDQLLASMLRSNPQAFIQGDVNRIKAGAVIEVPDAKKASELSRLEAKQILMASSQDFAQYRQRAAQNAGTQATPKASRESTGQVQATVDDKGSKAATPDKLKLSKGSVQNPTAAASLDKVAQTKKASDTQARTAELNKNVTDLSKVGAAAGALTGQPVKTTSTLPTLALGSAPVAPASAATATKTASVALTPTVTAVASATSTLTSTASTSTSTVGTSTLAAVTATAAASAPAVVKAPKKFVPPPPPPEPSFIEGLMDNPVLPLTGAGLLAALAGLFFWRKRQNSNSESHVDSSFLESRLRPDSFFGESGGGQVNTSEHGDATGSSMIYSPSQLDAGGDVDPVAEAEVYIAYGRDLQAEEILKEALRTRGSSVPIHVKLLDIYAKRKDSKAFQLVATEVHQLTSGAGPEWDHVCQMGRELDPSESMYQPGGKPQNPEINSIADSSIGAAAFAASTVPHHLDLQPPPAGTHEDLDLDLDLDLFADSTPAQGMEQTTPVQAPAADSHTMDFSASDFHAPQVPATQPPVTTSKPAEPDNNALQFDLGSLSLDLPSAAPAAAPQGGETTNTKLELAAEFFALGDVDGARALAQEVINETEGSVKNKAEQLLKSWS